MGLLLFSFSVKSFADSTVSSNSNFPPKSTKVVDYESHPDSLEEKMEKILNSLTPDEQTLLEKRLKSQHQVNETEAGISFYEPTYILPYYFTGRPYQSVYHGSTPNG